MTKNYRFSCYDSDDKVSTTIEFDTENDCWDGYNGPMWKFFDFLKGCGYVFHNNAEIGIADGDNFTSAADKEF